MVFGTFDNLHPGHLDYFRQARRFGEELIVVVARDKNVFKIKHHWPREKEAVRARKIKTALKASGWKGKAVLGSLADQWLVLKKYRPDVIALGYDQKVNLKQLKSAIAEFHFFCEVKRLRPFHAEKYKSSYHLK